MKCSHSLMPRHFLQIMDLLVRDERRVLEKRVRALERGETIPEIGERERVLCD